MKREVKKSIIDKEISIIDFCFIVHILHRFSYGGGAVDRTPGFFRPAQAERRAYGSRDKVGDSACEHQPCEAVQGLADEQHRHKHQPFAEKGGKRCIAYLAGALKKRGAELVYAPHRRGNALFLGNPK